MKRIVHRQPAIGWSLVLLSTLLLTPSATSALLGALRQAAMVQPAREAVSSAPRRAPEDEALEAAARSGQLRVIRLEPAPEREEIGAAYAVLVPTRTLVAVVEGESAPLPPPRAAAAARTHAPPAASPRAPPFA